MSDIFLSYSSKDRERARPLVAALERRGWSVWWDLEILPGKTWDEVLQQAVESARCVVVVWTHASVESDWVRIEANEGKERGILVPALLDAVEIPLAFRLVQAARMIGWRREDPDPGLDELVEGIRALLEGGGTPEQPVPHPVLVETAPELVQQRLIDAAISKELPVLTPADLVTMIRKPESEGLKAILDIDEEYALSGEDVVSKGFEMEFPADQAGRPQRAELVLRVDAPDFDPTRQEKKIIVPPGRDSAVYAFLLTPQHTGTLQVNLEVYQDEACVLSRVMRINGIPSDRLVEKARKTLVTLPVVVTSQTAGEAGAGSPAAAAGAAPKKDSGAVKLEANLSEILAATAAMSAPEPEERDVASAPAPIALPSPRPVAEQLPKPQAPAGAPGRHPAAKAPRSSAKAWVTGAIAAGVLAIAAPVWYMASETASAPSPPPIDISTATPPPVPVTPGGEQSPPEKQVGPPVEAPPVNSVRPAARPAEPVWAMFESDPPGAAVTRDDQPADPCTAPCNLQLGPEERWYSVAMPGYRPLRFRLRVEREAGATSGEESRPNLQVIEFVGEGEVHAEGASVSVQLKKEEEKQ